MTLRVRRRTRLRRREAGVWLSRLASEFGLTDLAEPDSLDEADAGDRKLLFLGKEVLAFRDGDVIAPTVRTLLAHPASRRAVTVDMGAVPYVYNGADVMAPGIVAADPEIRAGDLVWVRDERNGKPLAVGRALWDGPAMVREKRGKAIEALHHVGDDLWRLPEVET